MSTTTLMNSSAAAAAATAAHKAAATNNTRRIVITSGRHVISQRQQQQQQQHQRQHQQQFRLCSHRYFSPMTIASSSSSSSSPFNKLNQRQHQHYHRIMTTTPLLSLSSSSSPPPSIHNNNNNNNTLPSTRWFSSNSKRDFYDVLGVPKSADKGTIKKAYFKLAKEYHPDRNKDNPQAADKFKEATAAYEILSDDKQRERYDSFGHAGVDPNAQFEGSNPFDGFEGFNFGGPGGGGFQFHSTGGAEQIDPEELFDMFFGGQGQRRRKPRGPRRGSDLQMHVRLSFKEAVFGCERDLKLRYQVPSEKNKNRVEIKEREVTVSIPPGIDSGMSLRLQNQGAEGDPGAPRGNLLVQVIVDEDEYFQRDGMDVHTTVGISFVQAVLGGSVDVKTLGGEVEMTIPKGTPVGTKLVLRGKGIAELNGYGGNRKGNQIVHLNIEIPKKISKRQEELLREFDEESRCSGFGGISGRIAKAAGSAFGSFFGGGSDSTNSKDEKKKAKRGKDSSSGSSSKAKNNDAKKDDSKQKVDETTATSKEDDETDDQDKRQSA